MQPPPTEQTGVPAWNARPHTDAATPTCGGGSVSPLRGLPVASPGLPPARASATPRAHRQWRAVRLRTSEPRMRTIDIQRNIHFYMRKKINIKLKLIYSKVPEKTLKIRKSSWVFILSNQVRDRFLSESMTATTARMIGTFCEINFRRLPHKNPQKQYVEIHVAVWTFEWIIKIIL